jgi:quinoprotein glucose dehydrogenase
MYTPITRKTEINLGTWLFPGYGGGSNWNGAAFDPDTGVMYVPIKRKPYAAGLTRGDPARTNFDWIATGNHVPQGPRGLPITNPPYSEVIATDMNLGEHLWRIPIGGAPDFVRNHPALQGLGLDFSKMGQFDIRPSPLLTPSLLFLGESGHLTGETGGPMFRAYDKTSGSVLWEKKMPTLTSGAPMTYMLDGRQYVVIAVSDRGQPAEIIALALGDGVDDAAVATSQPAPVGAATNRPAAAVVVSPRELAAGRGVFGRTCALCHGPTGGGVIGGAPALALRDVRSIASIVSQGRAEMPAMASVLSDAEIDAVAKFVAAGLPK